MRSWRALYCLIISCAVAIGPAPVHGQIDPQADGVGVYFDLGGEINVFRTTQFLQEVEAFVLITRPSAPEGVGAVGLGVFWQASDPQMVWGWAGPYPGAGCLDLVPSTNLCCSVGPPWPLASIIPVARLSMTVVSPEVGVQIFLGPSEYCPGFAYWPGDPANAIIVPLHVASGAFDRPVAVINGPAPVTADAVTWGAVKVLYGP